LNDATRRLLADAANRGASYLEGLEDRPVFPRPEAIERLREALRKDLPAGPCAPADVLAFIDDYGSPATVASAGGRYFGFVTGGALPAAVAAHALATAWDQNGVTFIGSPATALFEETALRWCREVLRLPATAEGTFVTGATMASFTALAAARHAVLQHAGWDVGQRGLRGSPEVALIVGEEAHASIHKALAMLGFGRSQVQRVPVDSQGRMMADKLPVIAGPTIVCIQAGNVNSGAFDPAAEIIARAHAAGAWVHADGAFGLWARCSPTRGRLLDGFEGADSWATDAHKWLNVPYDCGVVFVREAAALRAAMSIRGDYLLLGRHRDAIDLSPEASRRARGVDVFAALQQLGRSGLAEMIDRHCDQANWLSGKLRDAGLEVLNEVVLNQVVVSFGDGPRTKSAVERLQQAGECWCGGTRWRGREAMRVSISAWATTQADMERTLRAILAAAEIPA
jgi:glutamate/tyrosine decarboxylase-like PLP-dependent enzyme